MNQLAMKRYEKKFATFIRVLEDAKDKKDVHMFIVHHPEILGDDYEELVESLNRLSATKLSLVIVPPSARATTRCWEVERSRE